MITHFIFMSSSYSLGKRIALHFIVDDEHIQDELKIVLDKIITECGKDVSISTHMIQAKDKTWESVCASDHFFKGVEIIDSLDKFIKLIKRDRKLKGIDIAKYILSKIKCTQLKLQKLVYLCYADYLWKQVRNYLQIKYMLLSMNQLLIQYINNIKNMVISQ